MNQLRSLTLLPLNLVASRCGSLVWALWFLCCLWLLLFVGCSLAFSSPPASLFEGTAAQDGIRKLQEKLPAQCRVLKVTLGSDAIVIQVQDPAAPTHVDAYTYSPGVPVDAAVSGPEPVQISRTIRRLDDYLFNFSDIDFGAVAVTAQEAVKRVALDGGGAVENIRIQRRIILLPTAHAADVEWDISIRGPRERASAYADARGAITGLDLKNTARARSIDYLQGGKALDEAIALIHEKFGNNRVFLSMEILTPAYLLFRAKDPKPPHGIKEYTCDINGIFQPLHVAELPVRPDAESRLFGFEEMDWSRYDALKKAALEKLAIADGQIKSVKLERPAASAQIQPPVWQLDIRGQEAGSVQFDQRGNILRSKSAAHQSNG